MTIEERVLKAFDDASSRVFRASRECQCDQELLLAAEKVRQELLKDIDRIWEDLRHGDNSHFVGTLDEINGQLA